MAFVQQLGQLRSPATTYATLPISGNILGDLRIVSDIGYLYTWMLSSGSGSLSDWKKVTVSSYNDLTNRPQSSPLAIDDAMQAVRNIYLNYILIVFLKIVTYGMSVLKMVDGTIDKFFNEDAVDLTKTSGQYYILTNNLDTIEYNDDKVGFYTNNFDGSLDEHIRALVHGSNYVINDWVSFDALRNKCSHISSYPFLPVSISHFNNYAIQPAPNMGMGATEVFTRGDTNTLNKDITFDFWVNPNAFRGRTDQAQWYGHDIIPQDNCYLLDNGSFSLEILVDGKIYGKMLTSEGGVLSDPENVQSPYIPLNPVVLEVTSISTLTLTSWTHIAIQRKNGHLELFINGVLEDTSILHSDLALYSYGTTLALGRYLDGYLDEIRYSYDIARYTSNFTPMTVAYNTPTEETPCNNMIIQSEGFEATTIPTSARVVIFQDSIDANMPDILPNVDIKVFVSRDGGTTFTQADDLKIEFDVVSENLGNYTNNIVNFFVGTINLSNQPNGKEMVYKITSHNNKDLSIRTVTMNWN